LYYLLFLKEMLSALIMINFVNLILKLSTAYSKSLLFDSVA
jgi:hypothetical protein